MQDDIFQAFDLMDQGKNEEALELLDQLALRISPTDKDYFSYANTRGYVLAGLEQYDEARALYNQLIEAALVQKDYDNLHVAYHQLAMVERMAGRYQTALDDIVKEKNLLDQHFPDDCLRHSVNAYEHGHLHFLLGNKEQAKIWLDHSLELALKTDDLVAQACAYRGLGEVTGQGDYLSKALALFKQAGDERGAEEVREMMAVG